MPRRVARGVAPALLAAVLLARPALARAGDGGRPWYAPDHAKLQLAGNVGFLSPGIGYALGRRVQADLFLGWVPEAIGGEDLFSVTAKVTWAPWSVAAGRLLVSPFTAALQLTYHLGDEYWLTLPGRFPEGYYDLPTALRAGVGFGSVVSGRLWGRSVGAYWELVALDVALWSWLANRRALDLRDVFSVALGARIDF